MKNAIDPFQSSKPSCPLLWILLLLVAIGCGAETTEADPPSGSAPQVDRASTKASGEAAREQEPFLASLADLITPDVVAVVTVAPKRLPKETRDEAVRQWERITKELGLPPQIEGLERISLLIGAPRDITLDWHARSESAVVLQFDDDAAAARFAEKVILVRGQLPIPMLFLDGDGLSDELRSPAIDWTLQSQGDADWWQWRTKHDLALFRASPTTFAIGASRIVGTMGQLRESLPLRRQILNATPSSIAAVFVDFSNDGGSLFQILRGEIREMKRRTESGNAPREDSSANIWHAQTLSPIARLRAEWFDRKTDPVTVEVTYSPLSYLDHKTTPALREARLALNQRDGAAYGKVLQAAIFGPGIDPVLKTDSRPEAVPGETTWKLTLAMPIEALKLSVSTTQVRNSLRQIMIGLNNYATTTNGRLPTAAWKRTDDQKPHLSWRVALLPFIDESQLYDQFRLDEPWDSPHNLKLAERMPAVFRDPMGRCEPGKTPFVVVAQRGTAFDPTVSEPLPKGKGRQYGVRMEDITDGQSTVAGVLYVDPDKSVPWTKPEDLEIDLSAIRRSLGTMLDVARPVGMIDGSVKTIPANWPEENWQRLLLRADGKPLPEWK